MVNALQTNPQLGHLQLELSVAREQLHQLGLITIMLLRRCGAASRSLGLKLGLECVKWWL